MKLFRLMISHEPVILLIAYSIIMVASTCHLHANLLSALCAALIGTWVLCVASTALGLIFGSDSRDSFAAIFPTGITFWISLSILIPNDSFRHLTQEGGLPVVLVLSIALIAVLTRVRKIDKSRV